MNRGEYMKNNKQKSKGRFLCLLLALLMVFGDLPFAGSAGTLGAAEVKADTLQDGDAVTIRFKDPTGRKYYEDLQIDTSIGETVTLPARKGYRWKLSGKFRFNGASKLTLSADAAWSRYIKDGVLTLRADKFYYVQFYNTNGTSTSKMKALKKIVVAGRKIKLPQVPGAYGYNNLGWSVKKNADTAKFQGGQVITVKRNLKFYAVRKRIATSAVLFYNSNGKTNAAYKKLNKRVAKGSTFTLPEIPKVTGYQGVGWTTTRGAAAPLYKVGDTVTITANTKFYAVREKVDTYTVSFYMYNGRSNADYRELQVEAESGSYITLPAVPSRTGYVGMGWSTVKNSSTSVLKTGSKYKVTKDVKLYAVQEAGVTVTLCKNDGSVYRKVSVGKGNYLTLPAVANGSGYTFLGWSRTQGKSTDPEFEAAGRIRVNGDVTLYAVVFNRSTEPDLTAADMAQVDLWKRKYKQVIFVGDSRTVRMQATLNREFGSSSTVVWNSEFVAQSGMGLDWLKGDGYNQIMNIVNKNNSTQNPTAVIFNLGVNDLSNLPSYVTYMKSLASTLKKKNCKLFYMSVNPGNSKMMENTGHVVRSEAAVRQFNSTIRSQLASDYTFIDTYSWLLKNGYGTNASGSGVDNSVDDGLHYTTKTYKRIYYHCLEFLLLQDVPK